MSWLRFLAQLHGHFGWLTAASLLHPVLLLSAARGRGVALASTILTVSTFASGCALYPSYRGALKRPVFLLDARLGWAFERKEHLAFAAAAFALLGWVAVAVSNRRVEDSPQLLRLARSAYVLAFVLALAVAIIGTLIASVRSF